MNNNRDYVNYVTRHLETLNTIIDQMESINRNMYSLTTRPSSRQTSSGLGAVGQRRTTRRSSLSRQNFGNQTQNQTFRRGATIPSEGFSTGLGNVSRNSTSTLSPLLSNVLASGFGILLLLPQPKKKLKVLRHRFHLVNYLKPVQRVL